MVNLTKLTVIKLIELILVIILLVLHYEVSSVGSNYHTLITNTAFGGYLVILIGVVAGVTTGTPINRRIDLYFTLVGAVIFIISATLIFQGSGSNHTAKGTIAIVEAVLFIIDAVFTFRGEA